MPKLLRDLEVFEVSSVDRAANKDARVLFWKRDDAKETVMNENVEKMSDEKAALIATIIKTWLAKGEDVAVVAKIVRGWIGKDLDTSDGGHEPSANGGGPQADLDHLVDAHMPKNPGISRGKATERVLRTSAGAVAYEREKFARLKKSGQLMGDAYGLR